MRARLMILALGAVFAAQPVTAQTAEPNAMMLAQVHDRCMATYAVRMTKTHTNDEAIFAAATVGCEAVKGRLNAAIAKEYSADQAKELTAMLDAQAKPNFMNMLQKIRSDQLARGATETPRAGN